MYITPKKSKLSPLLKYPGGKEKELGYILSALPTDAENYFEPFVGGGAVYFALDAKKYFINDKSLELMTLYSLVKNQDKEFLHKLNQINHNWTVLESIVSNHSQEILQIYTQFKKDTTNKTELFDRVSSFILHHADEFNGLLRTDFNIGIQNFVNELIKSVENKIIRVVEIEKEKGDLSNEDLLLNIECAFKSAFYMHFRFLYNNYQKLNTSQPFYSAIYFYIREYCYSSMFRYNDQGGFNVPYGGISYNRKRLSPKIKYFQEQMLAQQLGNTELSCADFEEFLKRYKPQKKDFMFLDPPYDTEFSTYAQNVFDKSDQMRLANYLQQECECYFMLVIKNTEFIRSLYENKRDKLGREIQIKKFNKKYFVSFQNRNNKEAEHLIITNYIWG